MSGMVVIALRLAALAFPFVAAPWMWRRMKRVRRESYRGGKAAPNRPGWQEPLESDNGLHLARMSSPNEDLIDLGDRARHAYWPLTRT